MPFGMPKTPEDFQKNNPHLKSFMEFIAMFNLETDRGVALSGSAMLENQLGEILGSFFVPNKGSKILLSDSNAPLASFSARAAAALALGLISRDEFEEMNLIRKIRNKFAHNVLVSFSQRDIAGYCSSLRYSAKSYDDVVVNARSSFTTAVVAIVLNLNNRAHYVSKRRLAECSWPY